MGWSRPPLSRSPPQAGPARHAATGRRPDRLGRGPDWQVLALRVRKKGEEDGRGQAKGRRQGKEDDGGEEAAGKLAASDRGWIKGAAGKASVGLKVAHPGKASAGLKVEGANEVQCVESLAERINRLAGIETRKALQYYTICVARNID